MVHDENTKTQSRMIFVAIEFILFMETLLKADDTKDIKLLTMQYLCKDHLIDKK